MAVARPRAAPSSAQPFIGRPELVEALRASVERSRSGKGSTTLLVGEMGLGKSLLVQHVADEARASGFVVLEGRAVPRELPQPFEPVKEAFRGLTPGLLRGSEGPEGPLRALWAPERQGPSTLLPLGLMAWREPGSPKGRQEEEAEASDRLWSTIDRSGGGVEEGRLSLFERLFQTLAGVARREPVLLLLEDIHLADRATLEFLRYVSVQESGTALVVLLTSVPFEEQPPASRDLLEGLGREGLAQVLRMRPLNVDEVREYLRWMNAGVTPDPEAVTRLFVESEGNPLFLERLALGERGRTGRDPATPTRGPARPAGAAGERGAGGEGEKDPLSAGGELGRKLLAYGAVLGPDFPFGTLARVAEADEEEVARALEKLVRSGVLLERSGEQYTFREEAPRTAILTSLTETRRRRIHRRLAEVMEVLGPGGDSEEEWVRDLAFHFHLGRHDLRSFEYNCRLFDLAKNEGRIAESRESLERALEAVRRLPSEDRTHRDQEREVLLQLGTVLAEAGELRRSEEVLMEAFVMFLPGEPHEAVQLALARTHLHQGKFLEARRRVQGLLPASHEPSPSPAGVEAMGLLSEAALAMGDIDEALARARSALAFAEAMPDHTLLGDCCRRLGEIYLLELEEVERARALFQRALRLFEQGGDALRRARLEIRLAEVDFLRGRTEEARNRLDAVAQWSEERGARLVHAEALVKASHHALEKGSLERSESALAKARELIAAEGGPRFDLTYALLEARHAHQRGDHAKARSHLERAEATARSSSVPGALFDVLLARAEVDLAQGRTEAAQATLEEARGLGVGQADLQRRWRELHHRVATASGA